MHISCENTSSHCPVVFPATCPPPRCDCQEDRSAARHCRLCHLPFDIENRLQPDSGIRAFCSCFLGESRVLLWYLMPIVSWMPVFYIAPLRISPRDSGRSSPSSLSNESNHSLPPTVDACLGENNSLPSSTVDACLGENNSLPSTVDACLGEYSDSLRKYCAGETLDDCLAKNIIEDNSVEFDHSLPRGCPAYSSTEPKHYSSIDSVLDSFVEHTCSLLPKDNVEEKHKDQIFHSDETMQSKYFYSLKTNRDRVSSDKGIFTELQHVQIPPAGPLSKEGTLDFTSSRFEGNRLCKNEQLNARTDVFSEVGGLEASRDVSCSTCNKPESVDRSLLAQVPWDKRKESTSCTNVTLPFISAESGTFSSSKNYNQNCLSRTVMMKEAFRELCKPLFINTNDATLNSSDPNRSSLVNRLEINSSAGSSHPNLVPFNDSDFKNRNGNVYSYTESWYPSSTLNASEPNTNHSSSLSMNPPAGPDYQDLAQFPSLNSFETISNIENTYNNEESRNPSNSPIAQVHYPFQYSNIDMMHHARMFAAESQQQATNVFSGNEFKDTYQVDSFQPTMTASSSSYQKHWSAENSPVHSGYNPWGNLASSNAGTGMSAIDSRNGLGAGSGLVGGSDLIQEILSMNRAAVGRNNQLAELIRNMK